MKDFEIVNTDDKLNLLMAAINKVNTSFHMKFDTLNKKLTDPGGVMTKIASMEKSYEELLVRVDEGKEIPRRVLPLLPM